ncbi:MAG: hypothetical protein JXN62_04760, partial [Bacteroidales bacterium]|nr:hypothetical protein [Bacteroidales bacterium]
MDKNTITGLILIFLIFIGFSIYNNNKLNKNFRDAVAAAETEIAKGNLERARTEYVNALRFKPNQPEVLVKIRDLNEQLGIIEDVPSDSVVNETAETTQSVEQLQPSLPADSDNGLQYGVFAGAANKEDGLITLENNLIELKISLKGGKVYSARLKEFVTHDGQPLILFSGDSTVFGFK